MLKSNLKKFIDFFCDVQWIGGWSKTINWNSIFVNKEFGEIPFDCTAEETVLLFLQELVQWNG